MRLVTRRIISESINALRTLTECCILSKKCNFLSDLWIDKYLASLYNEYDLAVNNETYFKIRKSIGAYG